MSSPQDLAKAHFDHVYDHPDCRSYYRALSPLDYQNPRHLVPALRAVLAEIRRLRGVERPWVLDFACGYGIGGALLRHDVSMAEVLRGYDGPALDALSPNAVIARDTAFYAACRRTDEGARILGVDVAANAVAYALAAGLVDEGHVENLEDGDPSPALARRLGQVDAVLEAGAVGYYYGARAYERILAAAGARRPWIVMGPMRPADMAPVFTVVEAAGLVVEKAPWAPYRHRRFRDEHERETVLTTLAERGLDPAGLEADGWYYAELHVARPREEAARPLADIVGEREPG